MQGKIQTRAKLEGKVTVGTGSAPVDIPVYDGAYVVTPGSEDIVLQTADKLMEQDVTVKAVITDEDAVKLQSKTVMPDINEVVVTPDAGFTALSDVRVGSVMDTPYIQQAYDSGYEAGLKDGEGGGSWDLPYAQELEWIQADGTQYIDTGFAHKHNTKVVLDISDLTGESGFLFGARGDGASAGANAFTVYRRGATKLRSDYFASQVEVDISDCTPRTTLTKDANIVTAWGVTIENEAVTGGESIFNMLLFALNNNGVVDYFSKYRFYSCQIYDGEELARDFIPVLDLSGAPCLYDKVGGGFYYNAGSGFFSYSRKKEVPDRIYPLEYLEGDGTRYLDTGYKPNTNTKMELVMQISEDGTDTPRLFGAWNDGSATWMLNHHPEAGWQWFINGKAENTCASIGRTEKVTIVIDGKNCTINGIDTSRTTDQTWQCLHSMYLFGVNNGGQLHAGGAAKYKLWSCKIWDGDVLVRDYIPVLDMGGIACLYDKVGNSFYYMSDICHVRQKFIVKTITTTGSYDTASYHGAYWAAVDNNGNLILVIVGGTSTSYESINFTAGTMPEGVALSGQTGTTMTAVSKHYAALFTGINKDIDITLAFDGRNADSDYTNCTVTIA